MKRLSSWFCCQYSRLARQQSCATKAAGKEGQTLAGAAKTSFMKKCCEDSAVGSDGKKLSGAAKASFIKKCEAGG